MLIDYSVNARGPLVVEVGEFVGVCLGSLFQNDCPTIEAETGQMVIDSPTPVDILATTGVDSAVIVAVRVIPATVTDIPSVDLLITWSDGTDQRMPLSDLYFWKGKTQRITGLKIEGTATIEFLVAGDA